MQRTHRMLQDDFNKLESDMSKAQATADSATASLKKLQGDYETLREQVRAAKRGSTSAAGSSLCAWR